MRILHFVLRIFVHVEKRPLHCHRCLPHGSSFRPQAMLPVAPIAPSGNYHMRTCPGMVWEMWRWGGGDIHIWATAATQGVMFCYRRTALLLYLYQYSSISTMLAPLVQRLTNIYKNKKLKENDSSVLRAPSLENADACVILRSTIFDDQNII